MFNVKGITILLSIGLLVAYLKMNKEKSRDFQQDPATASITDAKSNKVLDKIKVRQSSIESTKSPATKRKKIANRNQELKKSATIFKEGQDPSQILDGLSPFDQLALEAIKLIDDGDVEGGVAQLQRVLEEDPSNQMAMEELGMFYMDRDEWEKAIPYFEKLLVSNPNNPIAVNELSHIIEETDGPEEAELFLKELNQTYPNSVVISTALAEELTREGKYSEAIPLLEDLANKSESGLYEKETLANAYFENGEYDKANDNYQRVIDEQDRMIREQESKGEPTDELIMERIRMRLGQVNVQLKARRCDQAEETIHGLEVDLKDDPEVRMIKDEFLRSCR